MSWIRPTSEDHEAILAYVTSDNIWGQEQKIVIGYRPSYCEAQTTSFLLHIHTAEQKLGELHQLLSTYTTHPKGPRPTRAGIRTRIKQVLKHDNLNRLMSATLSGRTYRQVTLTLAQDTVQHDLDLYGGKTIHSTNRQTWSALDIIQAYRERAVSEAGIQETTGLKQSVWWPLGQWTDQKIQVHGVSTFLALLLKSFVQKKLHEHGIRRCWHAVVSD
jgi:hypothetical protein